MNTDSHRDQREDIYAVSFGSGPGFKFVPPPVDEAFKALFPAMDAETPATRLLRKTIESFKAEGLSPEVAVAMALNLAAALAVDLVAGGAPRGKVVNALPVELRNRLQKVLPFT